MQDKPEISSSVELQKYFNLSNEYSLNVLGYKPEETSLQQIPKNKWGSFTAAIGKNPNSLGIYLPRNQTAVIQEQNSLSLFHEYFGHGLYCEQSLSGRKLVDLEKELLKEEEQKFQNKKFTLEDIQKFRKGNKIFQELDNFRQENLFQYELFAIWTEYLLSRELGNKEDFDKKYDSLEKEDREAVDSAINFNNQFGNLATFYGFGMKKIQDKKRLLKLSQDLFGKSLNHTPLMLHFGSGKPFSDIDLFVASNDIPPIYDYWIDVRAYKLGEIKDGIRVLNPMITDPIIVGSLIRGNQEYFKRMKKRISSQPITEEAINFSLQEYETEKKRSMDKSLGRPLQEKNLRSAKTYLTNALALRNGERVLTFKGLVDYSHTLSQSESLIELKGGIE